MLLALDYNLATHRPEIVVLVAGANDTWAQPEKVDPSTLGSTAAPDLGFRWECRILRFLRTLRSRDAYASDSEAEKTPAKANSASDPTPDPAVVVDENTRNHEINVKADAALANGDLAEAERLYLQLGDTYRAGRLAGLVRVSSALGRRERTETLLQELREMATSPALYEGEASVIAGAFAQSAYFEGGLDTLESFAERFPEEFLHRHDPLPLLLQSRGPARRGHRGERPRPRAPRPPRERRPLGGRVVPPDACQPRQGAGCRGERPLPHPRLPHPG